MTDPALQSVDNAHWRQLARAFADHNFRCLWEFGVASADRIGARSEHLAIRLGNDVVGIAHVRVKKLPVLRTGVAYINGGPLVRIQPEGCRSRLETSLRALLGEYVHRRACVLRVAPPLGPAPWNAVQTEVFRSLQFVPTTHGAMPYRTIVVDLDRPLGDVRASFTKKWRWHLTQSEKRDLAVRAGTSASLFAGFDGVFQETMGRKGFTVDLDSRFYARVNEQLPEEDRFYVCLAEKDGKVVAGQVSTMLGDTCVYLLGASTDLGRQHFASYLLQWHTIQRAHERSCTVYDLGGIDPDLNPGVYTFKKRMGGQEVTAPGPFEVVPPGLNGRIITRAERLYRLAQRLRRRAPRSGGREIG